MKVGYCLPQVDFKSDFLLSSLGNAVRAIEEAFGDARMDPSLPGVVGSIRMGDGEDKGDWDFGDTPSGSLSRRVQRRVVLTIILGLVGRAGFPTPDNGLDVLHLRECGLHNRPTVMKLHQVLTNKRIEPRGAEVRH